MILAAEAWHSQAQSAKVPRGACTPRPDRACAVRGRVACDPACIMPRMSDPVTMDKLVSLCKRRGFVFLSSEIYGGLGSSYDYGHYGVLLKNNVKNRWWRAMLQEREDILALDSAIIQHPETWRASGHVASFTDPL